VKLTSRQQYGEDLSHVAVWKPTGRLTRLGDYAEFFGGVVLDRFALAGAFIGVSTYRASHETDEAAYNLTRVNARTGHRETISLGTGLALLRQGCLPAGTAPSGVTALVIGETGAMAWISANLGLSSGAPGVRVCELPPGAQTPIVLAHDPTIVRDSLALGGHTLYWTQEGKPVSAPVD
jgi:hypothetical protein